MVKYFRVPEIRWVLVGDWHQPQMECNWHGVVAANGLHKNGRLSSYLASDFVYLEDDKRSQCAILKNFRKRLREADESQVPDFIEEGRLLFSGQATV